MSMRVRCRNCGDEIQSLHRHDYVTCSCGDISIDGGDDYCKMQVRPDSAGWDQIVDSKTLGLDE